MKTKTPTSFQIALACHVGNASNINLTRSQWLKNLFEGAAGAFALGLALYVLLVR